MFKSEIKIKYILVLLILLFFSSNEKAFSKLSQPPVSSSTHQIFNPDFTESVFYQVLNDETDKAIVDIELELSKAELKGMAKAKEIIINTLKSFNLWEKTKQLIIQHGKPLALTTISSEILTTLILPPLLISMDLNIVAALSAGIPSPFYMIPGYLSFSKFLEKRRFARELGYTIGDINRLNEFRKEILGYSIENKIIDVIINNLNQSQTVTILRTGLLQRNSQIRGQVITLKELENLTLSYFGKRKLKVIKQFSSENESVYANLLFQEINRTLQSQTAFFDLVNLRIQRSQKLTSDPSTKQFITKVFEIQNTIHFRKLNLRKSISELESQKSTDSHNKTQIKGVDSLKIAKQEINLKISELDQLEKELKIFEYKYLNSLKLNSFQQGELLYLNEFVDALKEFNINTSSTSKSASQEKHNVGGVSTRPHSCRHLFK